jgi:DnaJ domain
MKRTKSWGFPRWSGYGRTDAEPVTVRICDRVGCADPAECKAPKSPFSNEKWMFCEKHAAEFNRNWNFFSSMTDDEARRYEADDRREARGYTRTNAWEWSSDSADTPESRALNVLGLDGEASARDIKAQFRRLAKENHPDRKPGDKAAEKRFREIREAYEILKPKVGV